MDIFYVLKEHPEQRSEFLLASHRMMSLIETFPSTKHLCMLPFFISLTAMLQMSYRTVLIRLRRAIRSASCERRILYVDYRGYSAIFCHAVLPRC